MAKGYEVLEMLRPNQEWTISGDDYDSIQWIDCEPLTKAEFETAFAQVDAWKAQQQAAQAAKRQALLERLGITDEEAKLLAQSL